MPAAFTKFSATRCVCEPTGEPKFIDPGFAWRGRISLMPSRKSRVDGHDLRSARHIGNRQEVLLGIEGHFPVDVLVRRHDGAGGHEERIAVGWRLRRQLAPDVAACAAAIVHQDLLSPGLGELLRQQARHDIGRAARRKGHDDAHRLMGRSGRAPWDGRHHGRRHRKKPGNFASFSSIQEKVYQTPSAGKVSDISSYSPSAWVAGAPARGAGGRARRDTRADHVGDSYGSRSTTRRIPVVAAIHPVDVLVPVGAHGLVGHRDQPGIRVLRPVFD